MHLSLPPPYLIFPLTYLLLLLPYTLSLILQQPLCLHLLVLEDPQLLLHLVDPEAQLNLLALLVVQLQTGRPLGIVPHSFHLQLQLVELSALEVIRLSHSRQLCILVLIESLQKFNLLDRLSALMLQSVHSQFQVS